MIPFKLVDTVFNTLLQEVLEQVYKMVSFNWVHPTYPNLKKAFSTVTRWFLNTGYILDILPFFISYNMVPSNLVYPALHTLPAGL